MNESMQDIERELTAEHLECLGDEDLRQRAAAALDAAKQRYEAARGFADYYAGETGAAGGSESHWRNSGGCDAYGRELAAQQRYVTLKAFVDGVTNMGTVGYFRRAEIERGIRVSIRV